ncbi:MULTISPECIES: hypothetical protein [unclassified Streptomyces]|uniref:hypothetical protein n=1 Tax=unclassified Streptomyces TaxID=2593676 RepID=UPI0033B45E24
MREASANIRLVRWFLDPLKAVELSEGLRELLRVDLGERSYVDVEVPAGLLRELRDLAERQFWDLDQVTQRQEIKAAHITRVLIEGKLRRLEK